ncbi:MAG TPA: LytTR family DNA-binding domain-containing protein [Bacillota bacterium]|nr:LytTR family DNA-binding domain-containing protein [Peptococcaceae bacterium MAG4]NLW38460.1 response regulator transcription factor [Peptococcaceae bacterium]HPZ43117.1 LytTR family DNA-binding domain-containing protein [Bacillota bacterium]HQD75231.1 LytTR family DNA-binding domain-containing protein [Bacillota bacterium]HUM58045.1 LytTR family DNA-binding domain-containing protein [Bacillota bacterium]
MKLKALIVDDEYPARQELRYALSGMDNVEIVGEATNAQEALALIKALDYQILFLDISMPGMSGLELGAVIQELPRQPYIIFVTAFDEYAVSAFEVNAVDYILKPFEPQRLQKAIDKVIKLTQEFAGPDSEGYAGSGKKASRDPVQRHPEQIRFDRIPAEKQGKTILVNESDIVYAFTEKDYVYIKTYSDKLFTRFTLKELEARLNPNLFFRTHRCYLVNLHKVKEIIPFFNGAYNLTMEDKERSEVPVSRAQAKKLRKILGL